MLLETLPDGLFQNLRALKSAANHNKETEYRDFRLNKKNSQVMAMHNNDSEFHFSLNKKEHPSTVLILLVLELRVERFLSQSYRPIRKIPLDKFRIPGLLTNSDQTLPTSLLLAEASSLPLLLIPPFCETWKFAKTFLCTRPS